MPRKPNAEGPSKAEMVRKALDALGWKADLDAYHQWVVENYKFDMQRNHLSQYLSTERKKAGLSRRRLKKPRLGRPPGSGAAAEPAHGPGPGRPKGPSVTTLIEFITAVRTFESKLGASHIREVVASMYGK